MLYKLILLLLLIAGCETVSDEYKGELKEVEWIYYGDPDYENMTGCFWDANFPPILVQEVNGIGYVKWGGEWGGDVFSCIYYGEQEYIRHNITFDYYSIYSKGIIYPQDYDTLVSKYKQIP